MFTSRQVVEFAKLPQRLIHSRFASDRDQLRDQLFGWACFVVHAQNATVCWLALDAANLSDNDHGSEVTMATAEECRKALDALLARLSDMDDQTRAAKLADRTLSCHITDLGVTFLTKLGRHGADPLTEAGPGAHCQHTRASGVTRATFCPLPSMESRSIAGACSP